MELARCVRTWTDCKNVKAEQEEILGRPLSFTEWALALDMSENTLRRQVADGKAARELLIKTNINLIKSMAVKLYRRQEHNENRLSVDDLVLEGTQGIIKAAMKFDPYREIKFSTYAVWWIRQAISLAIQTHSNTVRLPVLLQTRIKKVRDARTRLYLDLEREPSHDEVAAMVGLPREKVKQIRRSGECVCVCVDVCVCFCSCNLITHIPSFHTLTHIHTHTNTYTNRPLSAFFE